MEESTPLTSEEICEQADRCDVTDREFKRYILQLLCTLNVSINANAGEGGGILKSFVASDPGDGLDMTVLNNAVDFDVSQQSTAAVTIYGTFTGTASFEGSLGVDGGGDPHWTKLVGQDQDGSAISEFTAPGTYFFNVKIYNKIQMRVSTPGTGMADYIWAVSNR